MAEGASKSNPSSSQVGTMGSSQSGDGLQWDTSAFGTGIIVSDGNTSVFLK